MSFLRSFLLSSVVAALLTGIPAQAEATWSVIAVDRSSGQVIIASATCVTQGALRGFPAGGLMDIQAIVVPGVGVAAAQAGVDRSRENQNLIQRGLKAGTHPEEILELLKEDPDIERRQFAILDLEGRWAGFSGSENLEASLALSGQVPEAGIYFSVQGNILASDEVVEEAVDAFKRESDGTMADRVMAAMEAADAVGGDRRCTCETEPLPEVQCNGRTSHVAYLLVAEPGDRAGPGHSQGDWSLMIDVTDENIEAHENANPVITLRQRYDAWRAGEG